MSRGVPKSAAADISLHRVQRTPTRRRLSRGRKALLHGKAQPRTETKTTLPNVRDINIINNNKHASICIYAQVDDVEEEVRDIRKQQKELRRKYPGRRRFLGLF